MAFRNVSWSMPDYLADDEIYTPPEVFERMGVEFDLDVCSPKEGLPWIPTNKHYHLEIDGLTQDWDGFVWCNPPYSKPKPWIERFLDHGNGVMLVSFVRSKATHRYWNEADGIVYLPANFKFIKGSGGRHGIFTPVCLIAKGEQGVEALRKADYGRVR
jgi:hypothetical protein